MEVLILAKTEYGKNVCVGGVVTKTKRFVRLLYEGGWYPKADTDFEIGEIWDIEFDASPDEEPHIEDVIIKSEKYIKEVDNITKTIQSLGLPIWEGSPRELFDGLIYWDQKGNGYVNEENGVPDQSIGFWISDKPLTHIVKEGENSQGKAYKTDRYKYKALFRAYFLTYKGCSEPIEEIPAGTIVRVSLAKWWDNNGKHEKRCSIQLSGWYE